MESASIFIQAPAKVNLALAVGPVDPAKADIRHPVCSWMTGITLYDDLTLTPLAKGHFSRYAIIWADDAKHKTEIDWSVTQDLAVKAHLKLEQYTGKPLPIQLKLEKRIPVGSGMGGGSSDAAAMLQACNQLFELDLDRDELIQIANSLGSDISFFLNEKDNKLNSIVEGFGEHIEPIDFCCDNGLHLVIVMPSFFSPTIMIYRKFDQLQENQGLLKTDFIRKTDFLRNIAKNRFITPDECFNDLEQAVFAICPGLIESRSQIEEISECKVCLTGSGAAMFLFCDNALHAEFLARAITQRYSLASWGVSFHEQKIN